MNPTIEETQEEIIEDFSAVEDWMDRYAMIIDMGNSLPPIDPSLKTPDRLIEGCQSRVWLDARKDGEGHIHFTADSDAIIVKGIIAMLVKVLNGHTPDEILSSDLHFIADIGLAENLSPTRSNGLLAMLKQMRAYALAYKAKGGTSSH
ncbi:MAG: SufE family protein [Pseudoflavonifractor sp.]|nr:SufE family protein [Alloprevotella sp.]MCM1116810.1 SufE family protein [Pseudoflavonifractor sp.]